jgi:glycosyltransferase involved in cell wall biosynthesis
MDRPRQPDTLSAKHPLDVLAPGSEVASAKKRILYIAYHFPPQSGSSGLLRSLKFCRYLPEFGWLPTVLSVKPMAYERVDDSLLGEIPGEVKVRRSLALDTRRHLAYGNRYISWLALPDRWVTWCLSAVPSGLAFILRNKPEFIFTTFPIATAVLIGLILHRVTRVPWVVDFRDSMTEDDYPRDARTRRVYRWIESQAIRYGSLFLFTAPQTIDMYLKRYPQLPAEKCILLRNGYDESDFVAVPAESHKPVANARRLRMLHAGLLYREERDPRPFFEALVRLKQEGKIDSSRLQIDLRASGEESYYAELLRELALTDIVNLLPPVPYQEVLNEGASADALLLFQGATCNHQIPAKAYEYMRLRRPIFALTTNEGDTAALLREVGGATIANMYDKEDISQVFLNFEDAVRRGTHPLSDLEKTSLYSRREQAGELARLLSGLCKKQRV